MSNNFDEGWEEENRDEGYDPAHTASKFLAKEKPLGILASTKHSLEPDMLFGWRPKLASCPLPLKFPNPQNQAIVSLVSKSELYKLAYKSSHFVSSVEVNQRYDYYWKYRSRYSLNLALIQEAAKQQSAQHYFKHANIKQEACEYSFSGQFECGNLDFAIRVKPNEYDCFLRSDSNTKGHCNWYFFSVKNHSRIGEIKINICNISKVKNLYNKGMRPYVREAWQETEQEQQEWSQEPCYEVEFVERICRYGSQKKRFELQFKYNFSKPNQQVFFAYAIPYSYSKLEKFIKEISSDEQNRQLLTVEKLCESLGGLNVPLLKITSHASQDTSIQPVKRAVIMSARIHPGQSHSSYVMEGVIRELLKKDEEHQVLRNNFVFYIIPMINVDGVVVGNYRTSYSGKDLNRQFKDLDPFIYPEITKLHELALQIRQKHFKGIQFYLDFHGHSSKKNLFAYGPQHSPKNIYFFKSRIFPKLIEDFHPIFSYKKSNFRITQGKKKTARAHMLWKLKIPMVYTFQVSNGMYETKNKQNILLTKTILTEAGQAIMKGFLKYVRMEMKIPLKMIQKTTKKQNIKRRIIKSSKGIRDSSIGLKRKSGLKEIGNMEFLSEKLVIGPKVRVYSRNEDSRRQENLTKMDEMQNQFDGEMHQNMEEFMEVLEEVKNTKFESDVEGGSDSESEGQDLDKGQIEKFFKGIKSRGLLKELKQTRKKAKKPRMSKKKLPVLEETGNIFADIKKQLKRYKNSELEELIKESKKLNSQMSYVTLPSNKQTLTKSPSTGDKLGKNRLYNIVSTLRDSCQAEKIVKVPIAQKSFNLQI